MASFDFMIPFVLHFEAGVQRKYLDLPHEQIFERARWRGYTNDPSDSGGPTMCGVTLSVYSSYRSRKGYQKTTIADLKEISFQEWRTILRDMFWKRWKADLIKTPMIAAALVDWTWGSGKRGITYPQRILGVEADGIVGPKTLAAVNGYPDQRELFDKIQQARNEFHYNISYKGPNRTNPTKNAKFLDGWNRRVNTIKWEGFDFSAGY